jgi:thermosome
MTGIEDQQMVMLPEGSKRIIGRNAQRLNILIGYAVANTVKSTLGPKGMDTMLVSDLGDIVITNDGATILEEMNVEHPAAKIMVEIAKTQDKEVGDGTTTSVVIAGYLLKNAGELLDQNIHPSTITNGYLIAAKKADELLSTLSHKVGIDDMDTLKKIASISMGSKSIGLGDSKDYLSEMVVNSLKMVAEKKNNGYVIDTDLIKLEKKEGGSVRDTKFIKGVVIDKEIVHSGMPKKADKAKVALIECPLEIEKTETDAKIQITSPDQMKAFLDQEEKMLKDMIEKIKKTNATVVFCQKGIDELAQHFLAKANIMAVRRVKKSDLEKLARATGGRIVSSLDGLSPEDLGSAGKVYEEKISGESMVFVEGCENAKAVTIFLRAGTEHVVNEFERAIVDAIGAVSSAIEDCSYVTGGGSTEIELAQKLREYAIKIGGREQLAIQSFADSLEVIPKTLAESTGMDVINTLVALRTEHTKGKVSFGISVMDAKEDDMQKLGIIEPTRVKKQAISSATEAAVMMLRIDDIIASKGGKAGAPGPGGMGGPGMGMGGDM